MRMMTLMFVSVVSTLLAGAAVVVLFSLPGAQAEPRLLYANLKTLKPQALRLDTETIDGEAHQLLRFSNTVYNSGAGPVELMGRTVTTATGQEKTKVYQRIYDAAGDRTTTEAVGVFAYHPTHDHFHFGGFAEYQLWTRAEYDRWVRSDRTEGSPRRADRLSSKITFCVMDTQKVLRKPGMPRYPVYDRCGRHLQGISSGWGDTYEYDLPDQWVDLGTTPLADGSYVLRSVADPENRFYESKNRTDDTREGHRANAAETYFRVSGGTLTVSD
jgi:hypothetical protein